MEQIDSNQIPMQSKPSYDDEVKFSSSHLCVGISGIGFRNMRTRVVSVLIISLVVYSSTRKAF